MWQCKIGEWKEDKVYIKLKETVKPFYSRPYSISMKQVEAIKDEV